MIDLRELEFRYPRTDFRLRIDHLTVPAASKLAMIGPSGSGKTTLLSLICGILTPTAGRVTTLGQEISAFSETARRALRIKRIGLVFQQFELLEHLNVLDNILLPCRVTRSIRLSREHRRRAAELAEEMGIADNLHRYVGRLSQGERQRVAICRALLLSPPLLLCDEPTGNLDPANKRQVLNILLRYVNRKGTTLLTVTHDHELLPHFDKTIDVKEYHVVR